MSVEIARFNDLNEAEVAAGLLRSAGIAAEVADRHLIGIDPLLQRALGCPRVMAPASQKADALTILAQVRAGAYAAEIADDPPTLPLSGPRRVAVTLGAAVFPEAAAALLRGGGAGAGRRLALTLMGGVIVLVLAVTTLSMLV